MADMFINNQGDDMFAGITRDESIDLSTFVKGSGTTANPNQKEATHVVTGQSKSTDTIDAATVLQKSLSPLEKELLKKEQGTSGLAITKEEYESGLERTEFKSIIDNDERNQDLVNIQNESDQLLLQRQAVVPLKQYDGSTEFTQMVHEISRVKFDKDGKAYFEEELDENGNNIVPSLVRLRTEDDPPFSKENDFMILQGKTVKDEEEQPEPDGIDGDDDIEENEADRRKKKVVQFLIDKTGLGADFTLTEEEKKKLVDSNEIRLRQVETLDIQSITTVRPDRESFTGHIHSRQLSSHRTTISFPASGFKADMQGLTYGEVGDISLSMETVNVDKYYKRMAIIYNKMKNISSGPFESFEDFLKGFAYTDIPLALYGIYVSTYPEVQTISLRCGRKDCAKSFDWTFSTRNILKLEKSEETMLEKMAELASADPFQYDQIFEKAPVRNSKMYKLPYCGYIVEMGIASAYEFLYNFIPVLNEENFKEAFGSDLNNVYMNNILLLTTVLSVRVPDEENPGSYILCEGYKDIMDAIYNISPEEIKILASLNLKLQNSFQVGFAFDNVVCPHCGNVTKELELTMDDLIFQTYQRLISTEIDLTNIQVL